MQRTASEHHVHAVKHTAKVEVKVDAILLLLLLLLLGVHLQLVTSPVTRTPVGGTPASPVKEPVAHSGVLVQRTSPSKCVFQVLSAESGVLALYLSACA
jgi:hypothetical protein